MHIEEATHLYLFFHLGGKQSTVTVQSGRIGTGWRTGLSLCESPLKSPDAPTFMAETRVVTLMAKRIHLLHAKHEAIAIAVNEHLLQPLHMS